ncbi:50S ribosomal protein L14e [Candidatus Woesearchaeota archaeon]|nr:50S ribosomal protein L14e [Candidatus Woesearchaeota archaeon]
MALFEVGRLCVKLAGRDAGRKCVVVEQLDPTYVLVDGATRRKKVNIKHLEPLAETIELNSGASHEEVKDVFEKLGLDVFDSKPKQTPPRKKHLKKVKDKTEKKTVKAKPKIEKKDTGVVKEAKGIEEVR